MSSYLMRNFVLHELNTLDAGRRRLMCGVIVVDAESFRSTWHGRDAYIHDHCLDILITMRFSINCSIVICSPTVILMLSREASSETYGWRVYLLSYLFSIYFYLHLYFFIYIIKYQKYIYLIILSLSDLTFVSGREGIDNPFIALVVSS